MYPYSLFLGIDLYTIFLCAGVAAAIIVFRLLSEKKKMYWRVQNLVVISAALSIMCGYFSAVFFQALYNIEERGGFIIDAYTGATFYGGLIGGAACFLTVYFVVGHFTLKNKEHLKSFFDVADIGAASIAVAHGLGRIGCLMAGCCHGGATEEWYGIYMMALDMKVVPTQLWEALFLFLLFAVLLWRNIKEKSYGLPIYMATYGVWRFVFEFVRKDDRGSTLVDFLTPSQLIALIMIIGSVVVFFVQRRMTNISKPKDEEMVYE